MRKNKTRKRVVLLDNKSWLSGIDQIDESRGDEKQSRSTDCNWGVCHSNWLKRIEIVLFNWWYFAHSYLTLKVRWHSRAETRISKRYNLTYWLTFECVIKGDAFLEIWISIDFAFSKIYIRSIIPGNRDSWHIFKFSKP